MDPLSDILSLLKLRSYMSGGLDAAGDWCFGFPAHDGIKFRINLAGSCWVQIDGMAKPFFAEAGECFLLPHGRAFRVGTRLDIPPLDREALAAQTAPGHLLVLNGGGQFRSIGGFCSLEAEHAGILLNTLPPVVRIRETRAKTVLRWCVDHMSEELRKPRPGGALIIQQLAQMLLVQVLRAHLEHAPTGVGWLSALADERLARAIGLIHENPGRAWTVEQLASAAGMSRTAFAVHFRRRSGQTPMEYLTRWRMLLADDRLRHSRESIAAVALSVGYSSESAFSTAYKRVMGASPRRHAKRAA